MKITYCLGLVLSALPLVAGQICGQDNCFRAVKGYQDKTSAGFCGAYLASQTAAPSPFATCGPARLSSACKCLTTASATITSTLATVTATATATTTATISTSSSTSASAAPTNLIINGGFESSVNRADLSPWTVLESGSFWVANNTESSQFFRFRARTGTKSAQMGHQGQGEPPAVLSQSVSLTAGTTYSFEAFYSVLDLVFDQCYFSAAIEGATIAQTIIFAGSGGGNPPPFRKLSGTYLALITGAASLSLELVCEDSTWGVFGLDDVSLI